LVGSQGVSHDVSVGGNDVTSSTSHVSVKDGTRNDLLFGKVGNGGDFVEESVGRVDGFNGGESPARSALTLVQDGVGDTLSDPGHVGGGLETFGEGNGSFWGVVVLDNSLGHEEGASPFVVGHVGELVDA